MVCRSSLYSTAPVGLAAQPRFTNAAVALESDLEPRELLRGLLAIEKEFGRDRVTGIPNGPRTLDLDLLLYGGLQVSESGLEIPHPRLAERAFVLIPLNEIAPQIVDPRNGKTLAQLLSTLLKVGEEDTHAVVQVQNEIWHAGVCRNAVDSAASLRTDHVDHYGRR
jgi:2-amino-4-hydroxy-6-hydroxymethyldihydropteridine diphosphokinase